MGTELPVGGRKRKREGKERRKGEGGGGFVLHTKLFTNLLVRVPPGHR